MKTLISFALENRAMVLAFAAGFILFGISAYQRLPVEAYPDVTPVQFQVITLFPGHAAEETEQLVTIPVENEFNGMPNISSMRSISLFGLSQVTVTFSDDASDETVRNLGAQHLSALSLPPDAQASLSPDSTPVGEIYRYTLKAPKDFPLTELKALEDFVVERQYRTVPGVADVNGFGGPTKQYQVLIDPAKLKSYNLTLSRIYTALSNSNQNAGGGYIEHGQELYIVRGLGYHPIGNLALKGRTFDLESLVNTAVIERSDVVAALHAKENADAQFTLAKANRVPDVTASLNYTHNSQSQNTFAPSPENDQIGFSLQVPIPVSNFDTDDLKAAHLTVMQADKQLEAVQVQAETDVHQSVARYRSALDAVRQYSGGILNDAQRALDIKLYSYKKGAATLLDVRQAESDLNATYQSYYSALNEEVKALVNLEQAAGLWDIDL
jgi:multidrug efflux pump subunit AcrB